MQNRLNPDGQGGPKPIYKTLGGGNAANKLVEKGDDPIMDFLPLTDWDDINEQNDWIRSAQKCEYFGIDKKPLILFILGKPAIGGTRAQWYTRCAIGVIEDYATKAKSGVGAVKGRILKALGKGDPNQN